MQMFTFTETGTASVCSLQDSDDIFLFNLLKKINYFTHGHERQPNNSDVAAMICKIFPWKCNLHLCNTLLYNSYFTKSVQA